MAKKPNSKDITAAASALGKAGGSKRSEAKTQAARANAKRPRNKTARTLKPFDRLSRAQQSRRIAAILAQHPAIGTDEWFAHFGTQIHEARRLVAAKRPVVVSSEYADQGDTWAVEFDNSSGFWAASFPVAKYGYAAASKAADKFAAQWNEQIKENPRTALEENPEQ